MAKIARFGVVTLFATAMAWVESAVVLYLRVMIDRIQPYQVDPLPVFAGLGDAELVREAATLVMLLCTGWLAGAHRRQRMGFAMLAFGVWDLFYYLFLMPLSGWPTSLLDWDILFLIPLPWWGPVLAPASIAVLMVVAGTLIAGNDLWPRLPAWLASAGGAALALYAFMAEALGALPSGLHAVRNVLPIEFNWPLFSLGWALMAMPVVDMLRQSLALRRHTEPRSQGVISLRDAG